jgi:hypothetical protein
VSGEFESLQRFAIELRDKAAHTSRHDLLEANLTISIASVHCAPVVADIAMVSTR